MRTVSPALGAAALGLWVSGCGGHNGNPGSPTAPSGSTAPPDAIVINVVAIKGEQSFSPNPSTVPEGRTVVWHNVDRFTHRIVLNDLSVDTGELAPGAFSQPMPLSATGRYHCTIHPVMVGTLTR
jgi:plastocyanin